MLVDENDVSKQSKALEDLKLSGQEMMHLCLGHDVCRLTEQHVTAYGAATAGLVLSHTVLLSPVNRNT